MQGSSVRDFVIERELGSGGMASVYLARQQGSGRLVALKLMHPHLAGDQTFVQRFLQEVRASAGLSHPNLVEVVACGEDGGRYFLATEFVEGGTIAGLLASARKLPAPVAAGFALQLLRGLSYAHERGIVHRDVKPANLMLTRDGTIKIGDFGIAKTQGAAALTQTGNLIGTPAYMSPEQALGSQLDARSDLFSAGVVFYEMLTGINPFVGENESTTLLKVLKSTPQLVFEIDPTVPSSLEAILERLLERDPQKRYASAAEAIAELEPIVAAAEVARPGLLAEFVRDPPGTKARLDAEQAARWLDSARERLARGPAERNMAALDLYRAVLLAPEVAEAEALLRQVCQEQKLSFGPSRNPQIQELEAMLERAPDSAGVLMQLASLYRLEGNLYKAVACFRKVLKLRPNDGYVAGQLSVLTGEKYRTSTVAAPAAGRAPGLAPGRAPTGAAPLPSVSEATELHTGRTGQAPMRPAPVVPPSAAPASAAPSDGFIEMDGRLESPWIGYLRQLGPKLAVVAVVVAVVWGGIRLLTRTIDDVVADTDRATQQLAKGVAANAANVAARIPAVDEATLQRRFEQEASEEMRAAEMLEGQGLHEQAARAYADFAEAHPKRAATMGARFRQARALKSAGRNEEAAEVALAFAREDPTNPLAVEAQVLRLEALVEAGRDSEVRSEASEFLSAHESSGRARLARARALVKLELFDDARKDAQWIRERYTTSDRLFVDATSLLEGLPPPAP